MTIELTEEEKVMTLEEFESQQEKLAPYAQDEQGNWVCGECKSSRHLDFCKVYQQYQRWHQKALLEEEKIQSKLSGGMCSGCDRPKLGRHRLSCTVGGARATQLMVPVIQKEGEAFVTHFSNTNLLPKKI